MLLIEKPRRRRKPPKKRPRQMPYLLSPRQNQTPLPDKSPHRLYARVTKISLESLAIRNRLCLCLRSSSKTTDISFPMIYSGCLRDQPRRTRGCKAPPSLHNIIDATKAIMVLSLRVAHDPQCSTIAAGASRPSTGSYKRKCFVRSLHPLPYTIVHVILIIMGSLLVGQVQKRRSLSQDLHQRLGGTAQMFQLYIRHPPKNVRENKC